MECTYFIKGDNRSYTYKELIEVFQRTGINNVSDIVFSKSEFEINQDAIFTKLSQLQSEGFVKGNVSYSDGEPVISDNDSISTQEFIDTPAFTYNGRTLITKMSDQDYINSTIAALKDDGKSQEEAEYIANKEVENWNIIGDDSAELHTLISKFDFRKGKSDFQQLLMGTKFERVSGSLYDSMSLFRRKNLGSIKNKCRGIPSQILYNINLKTELEHIDKTLFGHLDMVVIDGYGDLHLFNYKVTTTKLENQSTKLQNQSTSLQNQSTKLEKYKYQMALLKQVLASHGFKVRNATLNILPIKVGYNEDFSEIHSAVASEDPIEFTVERNRYVFTKYDTVAKHFIKSTINTNQVNSQDLDIAEKQLGLIFLDKEIRANGIRMTAKEWIRKNRSCILDSNDPEIAYEVEFGEGDIVEIKSHTKPENNQEIIEEVLKRQELLDTNQDVPINRFIKAIRGGFTLAGYSFLNEKTYSRNGAYLNTVFNKYFPHSDDEKSEWELIDNDILNGAGIVLLKHKSTDQLDIISVSSYDLNVLANFKKGDKNILGSHLHNTQAGELINYKPTYGNIEAVRTMVLLNQVLPKLEGNFVLGKLHVLSLQGSGQGIPFNMESLNKECFSNILKEINKLPETSIKNNFTNYKFVDKFETLLQEYEYVIKNNKASESEKQELLEIGFGALSNAITIEAKLNALRQIEFAMKEAFPVLDQKDLKIALQNADKKVGLLYLRVIEAITYYSIGNISSIERKISSMDKNTFISSRVDNRNFRLITDHYVKTINSIAEQAENKWIPIRELLYKFYDDIGYSRVQNSVIGNQAAQFNDLYRRDVNGNKLLRLLNPYDANDMAQIQSHRGIKQQFLKKILFEFAKIKYPMKGIKFNFTSESDPALLEFINQHRNTYFNIPLEKASASTMHLNYSIKLKLSYLKNKIIELKNNPKQGLEEFVNGVVNKEELQQRDEGFSLMTLNNKFSIGEGNERDNYIALYGVDYFETNLENLIADFIERDIETREYNKTLIVVKGMLFLLDLLGENPNLKSVVELTKQMIEDFIKINVFNDSIMDESSKKIIGILTPLKKLTRTTLLAGNVISAVRDSFEGVWQNTMRSINHYQTDIDQASLAKAYATVISNSFSDGRSINIVNQLCQIYRLSNIDVSRISEGLKSERGLMNFSNWAYATLRRPDFLNRMTLFIAKCYKDGVYGAFDIKDGKLVYDWKKDERFKIYASGNKSNPKYAEQMGAYYNAVRAYNLDHPEATIRFNEDLPMPYSFQEIEIMKNVANNIYGSYDKSTKAAYEHMALGTFFGMFSTWMNGLYTTYLTKPGQYHNGQFKLEQATDSSGNLKFFDEIGLTIIQITDQNGDIKYFYEGSLQEATENLTKIQPVMDKVPIVILGIWYTLKDVTSVILNKGNLKEEIWLDPVLRKNLDKLFSDLIALLLFSQIFTWVLDPAYKDFKKGMKNRDIVTNAAVELLYKSSSRSYDGFKGLWNVVTYLGENTNPPVYSQPIKITKDLLQSLVGNKSFVNDVVVGNVPLFRAFQTSYKEYNKSQKD